MAGLTHLIDPSGTLSATEVAENFTAIGDRCNNLPDDAFEGLSVTTRHLDVEAVASVGSVDRLKDIRSSTFLAAPLTAFPYSDLPHGPGQALAETPAQPLANRFPLEGALPVFAWAELSFRDNNSFGIVPWIPTADINYHFKLQYKTDITGGWEDIPGMETARVAQAGGSAVSGVPPEEATMVLFAALMPGPAAHIAFKVQQFGDGTGFGIGLANPVVMGTIHTLHVVR